MHRLCPLISGLRSIRLFRNVLAMTTRMSYVNAEILPIIPEFSVSILHYIDRACLCNVTKMKFLILCKYLLT